MITRSMSDNLAIKTVARAVMAAGIRVRQGLWAPADGGNRGAGVGHVSHGIRQMPFRWW